MVLVGAYMLTEKRPSTTKIKHIGDLNYSFEKHEVKLQLTYISC